MRITSGLVDYHFHPQLQDMFDKVKDRFGFVDEDILKDFWRVCEDPESLIKPNVIFDKVLENYKRGKVSEIYTELSRRSRYSHFLHELVESDYYPRNQAEIPQFFDRMWEIMAELDRKQRQQGGGRQQQGMDEFERLIDTGRKVLQLLNDPLLEGMFDPPPQPAPGNGQDDDSQENQPMPMGGSGSVGLEKAFESLTQTWDPYMVQALLISQELDFAMTFSKMGIWNPSPFPDNSVDIHKIRDSKDLFKLLPGQLALPSDTFYMKYAKKELMCREFMIRQDKRQLVYILMDVSGSMQGDRAVCAMSIALSLLRRVATAGDHYHMRMFEDDPHELMSASTKEEAQELCRKLLHMRFPGGGTDIQKAVLKAVSDIKKAKVKDKLDKVELDLKNCQILTLTDGESSIDAKKVNEERGEIKNHSVILGYGKWFSHSQIGAISDTLHLVKNVKNKDRMLEIIEVMNLKKQKGNRQKVYA
jgi:hypothetical protein